jgi:hypothetical protein
LPAACGRWPDSGHGDGGLYPRGSGAVGGLSGFPFLRMGRLAILIHNRPQVGNLPYIVTIIPVVRLEK